MYNVIYRERHFIDNYTCIDTRHSFKCDSYSRPADTELIYFYNGGYVVKALSSDEIIKIEDTRPARKYYTFETRFISLADSLSAFLKDNNIYYERSGAYSAYHFHILASTTEVKIIDNWLDNQSFIEV